MRIGTHGSLLLLLGISACLADDPEPAPAPVGLHLHRLNAAEYQNSLRAVLGVESQVARELPDDAPSYGFDNIADVLGTSPLLLELYAQASDEVLAQAFAPEAPLAQELADCLLARAAEGCVDEQLTRLTTLAWRRPPTQAERDRLLAVHDEARARGLDVDQAQAAAMRAVLLSPHFSFRVEGTSAPGERVALDDWELASRLSYFLWSAPPDQALLAAAEAGTLGDPAALEAQARRMLADPRAAALADNFAAQWLGYRALEDVFKDTYRFPAFTPQLRASMAQEPRLVFLDLLAEDGDLRELLTGDETYVDEHLAALYGLEAPGQPGFARVSLAGLPRRGLLTQAGLLSVLAYPFTTSPARRGSWVLENLLCAPMAAPPPGVDVPIDLEPVGKREELEAHRANPACASCHSAIDPIGLAFEGYDAIGQTLADADALDTAGALPSGAGFADPLELAIAVAEDPAFLPCAVQQTMTYALGRGLDSAELGEVEALADELARRSYGTQELFVLVATSELFRSRREEPTTEDSP